MPPSDDELELDELELELELDELEELDELDEQAAKDKARDNAKVKLSNLFMCIPPLSKFCLLEIFYISPAIKQVKINLLYHLKLYLLLNIFAQKDIQQ